VNTKEQAAQDFLNRANYLDRHIKVKLDQVQSLQELAEKATSTLSHTSTRGSRNIHRMEDAIVRMTDLQNEISSDIDNMVALRKSINDAINNIEKPNHQMVLELRYLAQKPWNEIAAIMNYEERYIFRIHRDALGALTVPEGISA
jgi:DNA-directed RNA polymerase specialized sigma subunit